MWERKHWYGGTEAELTKYLNMTLINNYRKLHGKPTRRWVHLRKLESERARRAYDRH